MKNLLERDRAHVWHPFSPTKGGYPLKALSASQGVYLITEEGDKIIDGIGSWWVNTLGHSHPEIADALHEQANTMAHVIFANFTHEPAVELSQGIKKMLPHQDKVFFSDNGSTSVEVALKIAIQYWKNRGLSHKKKVIALEGAYHGDTFGAMAVGERGAFSDPFADYLFDVEFLPFPDGRRDKECIEKFNELCQRDDVAAFIFEPLVQGAAGMRIYSRETLEQLLKMAGEYDVLTIADEIFTGFYRTGRPFATDHLSENADIYCLSKGLTAGTMALGLTTVSPNVFRAFDGADREKVFYHGHSFTGNPLACSVALKSMEILGRKDTRENLEMICREQEAFCEEVSAHKYVKNAKQLGTILSIEVHIEGNTGYFNEIRSRIYEFFLNRGVLLRPLGNVIYFLPIYTMRKMEINYVYKQIREFLNSLKNY